MHETALDPKVIDRIRKMLNLARDGGATEGEAQAAADAARKTMAKYNLTIAEVEAAGGSSDTKRTREARAGKAQYEYQQRLMEACAATNFCAVIVQYKGVRATGFVLIGREANVVATRELYAYLNATTERLAFEFVDRDNTQRLGRAAISFKTGCAQRLSERLLERHQRALDEQAREARERNASAPSSGTGLAVVMTDFAQDEMDRNWDFRYNLPEGTTAARRVVQQASFKVYQAALAAVAGATTMDRETLLTLASAAAFPVAQSRGLTEKQTQEQVHQAVSTRLDALEEENVSPAEKAKRAEQQRKADERFWERQRREERAKDRRTDWSAHRAGSKAAASVGLDTQVDAGSTAKRLG